MEENKIKSDKIPICINNIGLFFNNFFKNQDLFDIIKEDHNFQNLTESNKPDTSYRTGIYLSDTVQNNKNEIGFKLLRCSTNFEGPTENFSSTDNFILNKVNHAVKEYFDQPVYLNHVLAQIYTNVKQEGQNGKEGKERKTKIKEHSDKTKDMPKNGLIAFCTFYDQKVLDELAMTKLRFRLKECVEDNENLTQKFDVILRPNSLFIIPLSTNRLYTHEIIPSSLPIDKLPTRMGYVIRCSKTNAVFKNDKTYINNIPLEKPTEENVKWLKELYSKENRTDEVIDYGKDVYFSLNEGDYMKPIVHVRDSRPQMCYSFRTFI